MNGIYLVPILKSILCWLNNHPHNQSSSEQLHWTIECRGNCVRLNVLCDHRIRAGLFQFTKTHLFQSIFLSGCSFFLFLSSGCDISILLWIVSDFGDFIISTIFPVMIWFDGNKLLRTPNTNIKFMKRTPPQVIQRTNFPHANELCDMGLGQCRQSHCTWNTRAISSCACVVSLFVANYSKHNAYEVHTNSIPIFRPTPDTYPILVSVLK